MSKAVLISTAPSPLTELNSHSDSDSKEDEFSCKSEHSRLASHRYNDIT